MLTYLFIATVVAIIFIFSSKILSPIPYFPSQSIDIPLIIEALKLKKDQMIIDLGAGDGIVIFSAAQQSYKQKINTKFVAVEINPILILVLHLRRLFHPNRKNIRIVRDDIFTMNYSHLTINNCQLTFYLYISPWYLEKTIQNNKLALNNVEGLKIKNFSVVSYMYPIESLRKRQKIIQGKNKIFIYQ